MTALKIPRRRLDLRRGEERPAEAYAFTEGESWSRKPGRDEMEASR